MDTVDLSELAVKSVAQVHQELTEGDRTLDEMADLIISRVAKFFAECISDESFCALGVDEKRDQNGKLLYLRLVPCDSVGGVPARRIPKD